MKKLGKLGLVLSLAMFSLAPVMADAQAIYNGPSQPYIMYQAPPAVIYSSPPVMIQVVPEYTPPAVMFLVQPESPAKVEVAPPSSTPLPPLPPSTHVTVSDGGTANVCVSCSNVTQKIFVNPPKPKPVVKNGNGKKAATKPMPSAGKPWWDDPNSLWIWLIAAAIAILVLLAILFGRSLWGGSRPAPLSPAPALISPVPAAPAPATTPPAPASAPAVPAPTPVVVPVMMPAPPAPTSAPAASAVVSGTATIPVTVPVTLALDPINIRLRATVSRSTP